MVLKRLFLYFLKILKFFYDQKFHYRNNIYDDQNVLKLIQNYYHEYHSLNYHKFIRFRYIYHYYLFNKNVPYQIMY